MPSTRFEHSSWELDGVLVWVNPIQDGANRAHLDALLSEVASRGVFVSAHPAVIGAMGTKDVLYATRSLGWGTDTEQYRSPKELEEGFPARLDRYGVLVLKQGRGNGGNGVWRVEKTESASGSSERLLLDSGVRVRQAQPPDSPYEHLSLGAFLARCGEYFGRRDDPLLPGPRRGGGLLPPVAQGAPEGRGPNHWGSVYCATPSVMEDPTTPSFQALRAKVETEWVPEMTQLVGLDPHSLPVIWDADFLYGAKTSTGDDSYVLSEINVSAVWPYPPQATTQLVEATAVRVLEAKARRF